MRLVGCGLALSKGGSAKKKKEKIWRRLLLENFCCDALENDSYGGRLSDVLAGKHGCLDVPVDRMRRTVSTHMAT